MQLWEGNTTSLLTLPENVSTTVPGNHFPVFPITLNEVTFYLLLIWFLLLATYLSQLANEMAASLSRARLPSTDKQLQPHTVQMPYLTVPAIPGKRNIVQIMTILCFLQDHVHVDKNDGTVLLPFSLYSISVQTLFCSLCILLPFSLHHIDGLQIINKNRLCFIGTKE